MATIEFKKTWIESCWKMNIYMAHGKITMREIDVIVKSGAIVPGDDVQKSVDWIDKNYKAADAD